MRYPNTPVMKSTFKLFEMLEIPTLPYKRANDNNWLMFNGVRKRREEITAETWPQDPFNVKAVNGGNIPDYYAIMGPTELLRRTVKPFIDDLVAHPKETLDMLIKQYDHYSTRSYMAIHMHYPPVVINWIETMTMGTGWFDRAFM